MDPVTIWILATCVVIAALGTLWLTMKTVSVCRQTYRKAIWERAAYISQQRPDLVKQVSETYTLAPGKEVERTAPRGHRPSRTVQTLSRQELEDYAHVLEHRLTVMSGHWVKAAKDAERMEQDLTVAEKLRVRYWNRLKRIDEVVDKGDVAYEILHPALSKES